MTENWLFEVDHSFTTNFVARISTDLDYFMCSHEVGGTSSVFFDKIDFDGLAMSFEETSWAQCLSVYP